MRQKSKKVGLEVHEVDNFKPNAQKNIKFKDTFTIKCGKNLKEQNNTLGKMSFFNRFLNIYIKRSKNYH